MEDQHIDCIGRYSDKYSTIQGECFSVCCILVSLSVCHLLVCVSVCQCVCLSSSCLFVVLSSVCLLVCMFMLATRGWWIGALIALADLRIRTRKVFVCLSVCCLLVCLSACLSVYVSHSRMEDRHIGCIGRSSGTHKASSRAGT
jgi:hypothetical protein